MKKEKAEVTIYSIATAFTFVGTGLALAGLLLPYWYEQSRLEGIVVIKADIGIWQDRICRGDEGCDTFWLSDSDYDRHESFKMPKEEAIKVTETFGCAVGLLTILLLIPLWATHLMGSTPIIRAAAFSCFFTSVMVAGFLCEVGVLVLASEVETEDSGYAPFLCGIGGALLLIAGTMSCAVCRYDPSYGTLGNPVSPTFVNA